MRDADIRAALLTELRMSHGADPETLIIEELGRLVRHQLRTRDHWREKAGA